MSPAPERPQFDPLPTEEAAAPAPSKRTPLAIAQQMATGAAPPDTTADEAELKEAQNSRDVRALAAQVATQFGHFADVQGGTQTGDRGAALRSTVDNPINDLNAKRGLRDAAQKRQFEQEDRAAAQEDRKFSREAQQETIAAKRAKAQSEASYNDGASPVSQRRRALATSMYPDLVGRIPPETWKTMSAADVDAFLSKAAPSKVAGGKGGGSGLSGAQMNSVRNKLPQHLVDTYNGIGRVKSLAQAMGGWEKTKTGIAGGMIPSVFMDDQTRALRQELGGVVARFLQAGGGKSITANEEKILIGRIAADPTSSNLRPGDLERGLAIIERAMAADTRQSLAGVPESAKGALLGDMQIDRQWVDQDLQAPLVRKPQPGKKRKLRNPTTGEVIEVQ